MNRATIIAALAGLTLSATALAQTSKADPADPAKQPVPGATPGPGMNVKPKAPVKPAIVDLQDAAKQPRKRTPRTPANVPASVNPTVPAPQAPAPPVVPAPAKPSDATPAATPSVSSPTLIEPMTPIVIEPAPSVPAAEAAKPATSATEPLPADTTPAPPAVAKTEPAPVSAPVLGPHVSIVPASTNVTATTPAEPTTAQPVVPAPVAATPSEPAVAPTGLVVDIEHVAVKTAKGELRQSPVQIGAQEQTRSARQPVPADVPKTDQSASDAPKVIIYDQRTPNPAASLLPAPPVQSVLSSFVEKWASERGTSVTPTPIAPAPAASAPTTTPTPAEAPVAKPVEPAPSPNAAVNPETPVVATEPRPALPTEPVATPAPIAKEPIAIEPTPAAAKHIESPEPAKPLVAKPSPEPLPPVVPDPAPVKNPETTPEAKPLETVKPVEIKGPEVSALDATKIKLTPPTTSAPAVPAAQPIEAVATATEPPAAKPTLDEPASSVATPPATAAVEPAAPAPTVTPSPAAAVSSTAITPTPPAPVTPVTAKTGAPEPVALKVLTLTGTPGMVQWQLDGGTQWLIPELEETTKAKFVIRTGPDAGVEVLADETTRVRMGRFSRAELRTVEITDETGTGKRLNVSLMRGVLYVVPGKGKVVTVQTPQRMVVVKEPMQITHDNGGTRSVSFAEQPNPGTTATAPSANP